MALQWSSSTRLAEDELVASLQWLIRIRWLAGLGLLTATGFCTLVLELTLPTAPLYLIGFGVLAYNALFRLILARLRRTAQAPDGIYSRLAQIQAGADYVTMAALIHFTGGLESPAILYFFFHIVISAILLSPRVTYLCAVLATLLVTGTAALEYSGLLPHVHVPEFIRGELYRDPIYILGKLFFFTSTAFVVAYLAVTLNSRLRDRAARIFELTASLERTCGRLQWLCDGAQSVRSTLDLNQVLERLTRDTAEAMGATGCSIFLLDETKARLRLGAGYGLSNAYVNKGDLIMEDNPLAREVLAGSVIAINDVNADTRLQYPTEAAKEGIRSLISAPLMGKHGPLGLIRAYSFKTDCFDKADTDFLAAIADYGSIAIGNAAAYQALNQMNAAKSRFVLMVTHELRSPVSVVQSLLRTMMGGYAGTLTGEQNDILTRALRRTDFLQALIDDLLDLAAGKGELQAQEERVRVPLAEAVERVIHRFAIPAREKQIALAWRCDCRDRTVAVWATPEGVDRILNNLVSNAIKYTPCGGQVTATLWGTASESFVTIRDTGIGIPETSLPHLFEEFYRAPNAKSLEKEGTGLGLAISRDLATRYGGRIAVQSQVGQGTSVTVVFPVGNEKRP